jgi:hypothetical protein
MSVVTRAAWHNISEDGILHSHSLKHLRSYILLYVSYEHVNWYLIRREDSTSRIALLRRIFEPDRESKARLLKIT